MIVRGLGIAGVSNQPYDAILGDLMKLFPLAFWITATSANGVPYRLTTLDLPREMVDPDFEMEVRLPFRDQPPTLWPEAPGSGEVVMLTNERSYVARPKRD